MGNDIEKITGIDNTEKTYTEIRNSVISAQSRIYTAVNSAMVQAYWEIGEQIYLACGENYRAEYGKGLLKYLSEKLTAEFGKGVYRTKFAQHEAVLSGISNSALTESRIELDSL